MAGVQWFYAANNEEKGPVSQGELASLVEKGIVRPETLVWREGLANWTSAAQATSLFPSETIPPSLAVVAPPPMLNSPPVLEPPIRAAGSFPQTLYRGPWLGDLAKLVGWVSWPLLGMGFVLVLLAKGCDSLGARQVALMQGRSQTAQNRFQDKYEKERLDLESRRDEARKRNEEKGVTDYTDKLAKLNEERLVEQERLRRQNWRDLSIAARDAESENRMYGYWRECVFVLGSMILCLGLMGVSAQGAGQERWVCLVMLAIITFSIFVGGTAWIPQRSG